MTITLLAAGMAQVALGWWIQHRATRLIGNTMEVFYDTPTVAIGVISAIIPNVVIGRLVVFLGIGSALLGLVRHFYPDPKTTVLLALLEQTSLAKKRDDE